MEETALGRSLRFIRNFAAAARPSDSDRATPCAYHLSLDPEWISTFEPEARAFADAAIDERVVIISASTPASRDRVEARGATVPGAWVHAMALDNLLSMGGDHLRALPSRSSLSQTADFIAEYAMLLGTTLVFALGGDRLGLPHLRTFFIMRFRDAHWLSDSFSRGLGEAVFDIGAFGFLGGLLLLLTNASLLILFSVPPFDAIGLAAAAAISIAATSDA